MLEYKELRPQPGFQTMALSTPADIAILGGSAGCGKTGALLLEFLRHVRTTGWGGTIFRRLYTQIDSEGGLWDTARGMYQDLHPQIRPKFNDGKKRITFPSGVKLNFGHINRVDDVYQYQGSQIPFIGFDELTHFEASQFFYMLSRNRSARGMIDSYVRATCNPQGTGWVKDLISWWLYPPDYADETLSDYPIPERAGVIRYLCRYMNINYWGSTREECLSLLPEDARQSHDNPDGIGIADIKSVTFIPGRLDDNKILLQNEPGYKGSLLQLGASEQEQLLRGRWREMDGSALMLYNPRAIADLFTNTFVPPGENYMTADIALEGADKFVLIHWSGWRAENIYTFAKSTGPEVIEQIQSLAEKHQVPRRNIAFDSDGVGNFAKGYLRTSFDFRGNATPIEVKGAVQGTKRPNYLNLRAQCYYMLKDLINENGAYVNTNENSFLKTTIAQELRAMLRAPTMADMKLRIVSKDQIRAAIGRSPDYADNFAMRMALDLNKRSGRIPATSY